MDRLIAEIKVDKDELREICKEVAKNMAGKPELEGMANGQVVMQALLPLFPNLKAEEVDDNFSLCCYIDLTDGKWLHITIPFDWWEAPYREPFS